MQKLTDAAVENLTKAAADFGDDDVKDQANSIAQQIQDDAPLDKIVDQAQGLKGLLDATDAAGADDLAQNLKDVVLLCGVGDALADALAGGGGGAAGPAADLDEATPEGEGGGGGAWPGLPGGGGGFFPGGGGGGGGGGFDLDININLININLWFGNGWWPMVCCPCLPFGDCCWIGTDIFCCGTGYYGDCYVMYGPLSYCGFSCPVVDPLPNALPGVDYFGRIVLLNPAENDGGIQYLLADQPFAMEAGMMQDVEMSTTTIQFDRGPGFGEARYTLRPGSYKFVVTEQGWDIRRMTHQFTLDNTANASEFSLLLDGETVTVAARSQQVLTSDYPPMVEFNNGGEAVRKQLASGKVYTIGINDSGMWDLFAGDATASGAGQAAQSQLVAAAGGISPPHAIDLSTK